MCKYCPTFCGKNAGTPVRQSDMVMTFQQKLSNELLAYSGEEDAGPPGESTSPIADVRDVGEHDSEEDKYTMDDDNENAKEVLLKALSMYKYRSHDQYQLLFNHN